MLESINELINAEPFHAFKIILTSGHEYTVADPMLIAVGKTEIFFYYPKSDRRANLRMNQIAAVETTHHTSAKRN